MKRLGKVAVCLAGGLVWNTCLRADDSVLQANPYAAIVVRNVFGLNPPKPADEAAPPEAPPKITPNGIMSIFGQLQVLYKVAPKAGVPNAKEQSYVLSEGQSQDDIEVTQINEKAGLITFNNHGTIQQIPLANAPAVTAPISVPTQARPISNPNVPTPYGGPGRSGLGGRPGPGGIGGMPGGLRNRPLGSGVNNSSGNGGVGGGYPGQGSQQPQGVVTPEEQAAILEIQREQWKQQGNIAHMIIPPTALTPPGNTGGEDGAPMPPQ